MAGGRRLRGGTVAGALLRCALLAPLRSAALPARVEGRRLLIDGTPMHLKGVNWNPVPKGSMAPWGLAFRDAAKLDVWLMAKAGINVIRTYYPIEEVGVLDALWAEGIQVINTVNPTNEAGALEQIARQVESVKQHPAILMWSIGNEWNYNKCWLSVSDDECVRLVGETARLVKQHDSTHPVATVHGELPKADVLARLSDIDIWGINYYDDLTFSDLFDRWAAFSDLPIFIAEYGADAYNALVGRPDPGAQAHATAVLTQEIVARSSVTGGVCAGGIIFELADEWWKDWDGSPHEHDVGGIAPGGGPHPDRTFNEEWWGLVEIDRTPREAYHAYARIQVPTAVDEVHAAAEAARLSCTVGGCTTRP